MTPLTQDSMPRNLQRGKPGAVKLTHLDEQGRARMVDVGAKPDTERVALAGGEIRMKPATLALIRAGEMKKGDVLTTAQLAGIMAAKQTAALIPLCHPLAITHVDVQFRVPEEPDQDLPDPSVIEIQATVRTTGKTGVEMEALTAASVAALTIYDMAKAVDRAMQIGRIRLMEKHGGSSGDVVLEDGDWSNFP